MIYIAVLSNSTEPLYITNTFWTNTLYYRMITRIYSIWL